jgi:hypothetical protein
MLLDAVCSLTSPSQESHDRCHRRPSWRVDHRDHCFQLAELARCSSLRSPGRRSCSIHLDHIHLGDRSFPDSWLHDRCLPTLSRVWTTHCSYRNATGGRSSTEQVEAFDRHRVCFHCCEYPSSETIRVEDQALNNFSQVLVIFIWFVPESHIYHSRKGQHEQAKRSMLKLYGNIAGYDVVCVHTSCNIEQMLTDSSPGTRVSRRTTRYRS